MKILNFGSMNIDYVYQVDHFIRPGETFASISMAAGCGGKGLNQSIALAQAGNEVYHACKIGAEGGFLVEKLREKGVDTRYILPGEGSCGHAIIQVDPQGQNCILLYGGTNQQMTEEFIDSVLADFGPGDVLVLQNELNLTGYMIEKARERGMDVAFNAAPFDEKIATYPLEKLSYLVLNEVEGAALAATADEDAIPGILREKYPNVNILLTLGKRGCVWYGADGSQVKGKAITVEAVDTTAAGDTHFGFFLRGILDGQTVEEALKLAAVASGIAVTRPGAADSVPTYEEVVGSDYYKNF
jgi:ribokinase